MSVAIVAMTDESLSGGFEVSAKIILVNGKFEFVFKFLKSDRVEWDYKMNEWSAIADYYHCQIMSNAWDQKWLNCFRMIICYSIAFIFGTVLVGKKP